MNLTALKYAVSLAREKHFGRAAEACEVSQPTLSIAIKKLEEELQVQLFERTTTAVAVTPLGEEILHQAQAALERAADIVEISRRGHDPLTGPLKLGALPTISPYLVPVVMARMMNRAPRMPLILTEDDAPHLIEMLRAGEIDAAILSNPHHDPTLRIVDLYDEPFLVALPVGHPLARREYISCADLQREKLLLLEAGDCVREHILKTCPEFARLGLASPGLPGNLKGSSLETIKHMVAAGMGVTLLPRLSVPALLPGSGGTAPTETLCYRPFAGTPPVRRVVLAWRRSYTRDMAMELLLQTIRACELPGVERLS
ncbi:hydrogen peroxide-inducible genes activator [Rhodoferax sp. BAB1]|uniref:hydrogen peroxide-inducible genes activator n=1 Tax=Rhodoferax sp. BAB1 TaxID=2741720 RepID=UPI0015753BA7|nr:hydrogen peroxide-inducible genes activator [Rhodoferax sp. BAB1]QKO23665.1 hydrogen peroxide-inducible genes activator [Rhodoferax sp. BAB1]